MYASLGTWIIKKSTYSSPNVTSTGKIDDIDKNFPITQGSGRYAIRNFRFAYFKTVSIFPVRLNLPHYGIDSAMKRTLT